MKRPTHPTHHLNKFIICIRPLDWFGLECNTYPRAEQSVTRGEGSPSEGGFAGTEFQRLCHNMLLLTLPNKSKTCSLRWSILDAFVDHRLGSRAHISQRCPAITDSIPELLQSRTKEHSKRMLNFLEVGMCRRSDMVCADQCDDSPAKRCRQKKRRGFQSGRSRCADAALQAASETLAWDD